MKFFTIIMCLALFVSTTFAGVAEDFKKVEEAYNAAKDETVPLATDFLATYPNADHTLRFKVHEYRMVCSPLIATNTNPNAVNQAEQYALEYIEEMDQTNDNTARGAANYRLGEVYRYQGRLPDAIQAYNKSIAIAPSTTAFYMLAQTMRGRCEQSMGNNQKAEETFLAALNDDLIEDDEYSIHQRYAALRDLYVSTKQGEKLDALIIQALAEPKIGERLRSEMTINKANRMAETGDSAGAIELLNSNPRTLENVSLYIKLDTDPADRRKAVAGYLVNRKPGTNLNEDEIALLKTVIPPNDVSNLLISDAQVVAEGLKVHLRKQTGRLNVTEMADFVKQLQSGDGTKLLIVTDEAKALADEIALVDAPLKAYLVPLFKGEYATAAKVAFGAARAADNDTSYTFFISALSAAVRCNDQCYNGRALDVIKWVNGEIDVNPVTDLLQ